MWTAVLNPTNWAVVLLAAGAVVAPGRVWRRAASMLDRRATHVVIAAFVVAATGAAGARVVWGYVAPGAYLEELAAARLLLEGQRISTHDARTAIAAHAEASSVPRDWLLEGLSSCHAGAVAGRASFFTRHGHPPFLLVASVPIVAVGGGRVLFLALALLSVTAVLVAARVLLANLLPEHAGRWPVLATVLLAWQPVLASLRQGDAAWLAGALAVVAWAALRHQRPGAAGAAAGAAASVSPGMLVLVPAVAMCSSRAAGAALSTIAIGLAVSVLGGGVSLLSDVASSGYTAAVTHAMAGFNYSLLGRALAGTTWATATAIAFAGVCVMAALRGGRPGSASTGSAIGSADTTIPVFCCLAVVVSPVAWSQQLSFLLLPLGVLLATVMRKGHRMAIVAWCVLILLVSLPDQLVSRILHATAAFAGIDPLTTLPVPIAATVSVGVWLAALPTHRAALPAATPAHPPDLEAGAGVAGGAS